MIPIYGRGRTRVSPRFRDVPTDDSIPQRPAGLGQRTPPHRRGSRWSEQNDHAVDPSPSVRAAAALRGPRAATGMHALTAPPVSSQDEYEAAPFHLGSLSARPTSATAGGRDVHTAMPFFPSLFGMSSTSPTIIEQGGEALSPEQAQQVFLSRLLLALGSFVILCLLLF